MNSKNQNENKKSRRDFFKLGLTLGAGALTGAGLISMFSNAEAQDLKVIQHF